MTIIKTTRLLIAVALLAIASSSYAADNARAQARTAAVTDGASTIMGLAIGAAEMNPIGPVLAIGLKAVILHKVDELPEEQQAAQYAVAASVWGGATANNLCVAASIISGGAFAPACIALGVAWGIKVWKDTEEERIFWSEGCPMLRQYAEMPDLKCVYSAPDPAATPVAFVQAKEAP